MTLAVIVLAASSATLIVSFVLPPLVDLVTKRLAVPWVKAAVLGVLVAADALFTNAVKDGTSVNVNQAFWQRLVVAGVVAVGSFFGWWRPLGISGKDGALQRRTPDVGVGPVRPA